MKAGNTTYAKTEELPETFPVFPLSGALLLPSGNMPLNIFEPRYLAMIEDALKSERVIGMVQPKLDAEDGEEAPPLCEVGCMGRLTAFQETGDGRMLVNLAGIARFRMVEEVDGKNGYRRVRGTPFAEDLGDSEEAERAVDRDALMKTFRDFLEANDMEADWEGVQAATTETLVNSLSMMSPFGPPEKQALLEAPDLKTRAETLIAITEILLAREAGDGSTTLQ